MTFQEFKANYQKVPVVEYPNTVQGEPLVSVCVQTYQHAAFIRECLDGILMQETDFRFEILLGEDASTDGTREICIEYAERFPYIIRLFLHHRRNNISINGKPTGRFNFLNNIYNSKAKYIAFCEGDDVWTNRNKLQMQVGFLMSKPDFAGVGCYNSRMEYRSAIENIVMPGFPMKQRFYNFNDLFMKGITGWRTCTMVYKRAGPLVDFPEWGFKLLSGDIVIVVSMLKNVGAISILPFIGALYRVHLGGLWSSLTRDQIQRNIQINYEMISLYVLDTYYEKMWFYLSHIRKTIRYDIYNLNFGKIYRGLSFIFKKRIDIL